VRSDPNTEAGLERVVVRPEKPAHETPILFVHGMWHGAWCWGDWQQILAEGGWESHAISLPGHGASPARKSVRFSTMDDYLAVLRSEIERFERPPIIIGHSMGGALVQWHLRKIADDFPAVVLVGSWTSHSTIADGALGHLKRDPWGFLQMGLTLSSMPLVRSPEWAASLLITEGATLSPAELHARLCRESGVVLSQHNPPLWAPKRDVASPMLWIAGERDAVITLEGARRSARYYGADFHAVPDAGHNLMMEKSYVETARYIDGWLRDKVVVGGESIPLGVSSPERTERPSPRLGKHSEPI
jgi:pimeloyl-ACP methyl ester carboxylesterase